MYQDYYFSMSVLMTQEVCYVDVRKGVPEEFLRLASQVYLKKVSIKGEVFRFCLTERFLSKKELSDNHLHVLRLKKINAYKVLNSQKLNCYLKHPLVKQNEI